MPKERRDISLSHGSCRTSPYPSSSSRARRLAPKTPLESEDNIKEWEEAQCPVCLEHPHNAVLLICSSHERGCHPYMCNTSYRHSNCLDQFCRSFSKSSQSPQVENHISNTDTSHGQTMEADSVNIHEESSEGSVTTHHLSCEDMEKPKLVCPLCRGQIKEWKVVEAARHFMNEKLRCCSCETCYSSGTYADLRKHARLEHPLLRPSLVDPGRQHDWRRLERQRDVGDLFSTLQSSFGENRVDDGMLPIDDGGWLAVFFLVLHPASVSRGSSGTGLQMHIRRRSTRLWGEALEEDSPSSSRDDEHESSDGGSGPQRHRVQRQITPENEP